MADMTSGRVLAALIDDMEYEFEDPVHTINMAVAYHSLQLKKKAESEKSNMKLLTSTIKEDPTQHSTDLAFMTERKACLAKKKHLRIIFFFMDTDVSMYHYVIHAGYLSPFHPHNTFTYKDLQQSPYFTQEELARALVRPKPTVPPAFLLPVFVLPHPKLLADLKGTTVNMGRIMDIASAMAVLLCDDETAVLPSGDTIYAFANLVVTPNEEGAVLLLLIASICKNRQHLTKFCEMFSELLHACERHQSGFTTKLIAFNPRYTKYRLVEMLAPAVCNSIASIADHYADPSVYETLPAAVKCLTTACALQK